MPAASRARATSLAEVVEALWRAFSIALTVLALKPAPAARCAWFHRSRTRAARNRRPFSTASSGSMVSSWLQQGHHARKHRPCNDGFVADEQGGGERLAGYAHVLDGDTIVPAASTSASRKRPRPKWGTSESAASPVAKLPRRSWST